jgi:hypothetical protein
MVSPPSSNFSSSSRTLSHHHGLFSKKNTSSPTLEYYWRRIMSSSTSLWLRYSSWMELYYGKGSARRTLSSCQASLRLWESLVSCVVILAIVSTNNSLCYLFWKKIGFIIADHMLSNLFCSSLGASIHACQDNGCHLLAFKSNFFTFKASFVLLCDSPHPPLHVEVALSQTIAFNNDNSPPKHLVKYKHLSTLIILVY